MNELDTSELAGLDHRGAGREHAVVSAAVAVRRARGRQEPEPQLPGSHDGTYTDVLARSIFEQLIEPADVLLDLHGGDLVEALEPFAIYDASPVEERAHAIALAFGLPYVVRQELDESGLGGMTSSAAAQAGIPAVIAEAGGCGQLEEAATSMLVEGVRNVLRHLEMLPGEPIAVALARSSGSSSGCARRRRAGGSRSSRPGTRSPRDSSSARCARSTATCSRSCTRRATASSCS